MKMRKSLFSLTLPLCAALAGCTYMAPREASADLLDRNGIVTGSASFTAMSNGVEIEIKVSGLTPGLHGMHIHMNPNCTDTTDAKGNTVIFGGAGGHFDPAASNHHSDPSTDNKEGHGGDLPMLRVGADGTGTADFFTTKVSLVGDNSAVGRSIIIHANPDDYTTQPAGNSGARERCGIIKAPQ